ncbi:BnaCnng71340D [Brassica napus]|uniref:BnaCnng71340D protein n=1 Tax=Brassica napus TaxID=3708 RepID=A0A078JZK7_BRANA|nr:BnaCnng71340D [Brassica napus]
MESTVEVSALDLLSRRWSRMKRKRKLATAQSQASVGMGLLAGLYLYGSHSVIIVASVDSGVSVDVWTSYAVRIMAISLFPFVIV